MDKVTLEDFITESLKAIAVGVKRARDESRTANGIPIALSAVGGERTTTGEQLVRFSVSVEVSREKSSSGKASISIPVISMVTGGAEGEKGRSSQDRSVHTIEFNVPMHFNSAWGSSESEAN